MEMSGEWVLLSVLFVGVESGIGREVYEFVRWKRQLNHTDVGEWARVVQLLRR